MPGRTNTAGRAGRPPGASTAAPVRDFTRAPAQFAVEWDVRPAYDFLFSLSSDAGSTDDLPADDRRWLEEAKAGLETSGLSMSSAHGDDSAVHLAGFVVEHPALRTAADVVRATRDAGPGVLRWTFGDALGIEPGDGALVERALEGDQAALADVRSRLATMKHKPRIDVFEDPKASFDRLVRTLERWAEPFSTVEPRVAAILERDYERRAADRATYTGSDLIERTTNGVRLVPDSTVRRVVLAPSYFSRPFNFLLGGEGWRFAGYPVADAALDVDPLSPPASVLRLHRALGDATRLRILKLLADQDRYGTEMAEILELSKPTISHHLAQLRVAGLVTIIEAGNTTYYRLRRERLDDASGDLRSFLAG